jgi:hypothetical protein
MQREDKGVTTVCQQGFKKRKAAGYNPAASL